MTKIEAVIDPAHLYAALTALHQIAGMPAFTVTELRGYPRGHDQSRCESGGSDAIQSVDRVKIECVVPEAIAGLVRTAIMDAVQDADCGDEQVIRYEVEDHSRVDIGRRPDRRV